MTLPDPERRLRDAERRKATILDAAIEIIGTGGYNAFTIQDVASRCGLTNGGLLYHFPSKELLLLAVLQERDRRLAEQVINAFGSELQAASPSVVREVFRDMVKRIQSQPALTRLHAILQAEAISPSHPAHGHFLAREAMTLEGFEALVQAHVANPSSTARLLHALMDGLALQWLRAQQGFDLVDAWDQAVANLGPLEGG